MSAGRGGVLAAAAWAGRGAAGQHGQGRVAGPSVCRAPGALHGVAGRRHALHSAPGCVAVSY